MNSVEAKGRQKQLLCAHGLQKNVGKLPLGG